MFLNFRYLRLTLAPNPVERQVKYSEIQWIKRYICFLFCNLKQDTLLNVPIVVYEYNKKKEKQLQDFKAGMKNTVMIDKNGTKGPIRTFCTF